MTPDQSYEREGAGDRSRAKMIDGMGKRKRNVRYIHSPSILACLSWGSFFYCITLSSIMVAVL